MAKKKGCSLCASKVRFLDYKDIERLSKYLSDRGRIRGRKLTHTCAKHQRMLSRVIKRARNMGLLPYVVK